MHKIQLILFLLAAAISASGASNENSAAIGAQNTAAAAPHRLQADDVLVVGGAVEQKLRASQGEHRFEPRSLVAQGSALYVVFPGAAADTQLNTSRPTFWLSVPAGIEPADAFVLTAVSVRRSDKRELLIGSGTRQVSLGVPSGRCLDVSFKRLSDQSRAAPGCVLYEARPEAALAPGQYTWVTQLKSNAQGDGRGIFYAFGIAEGAR